MSVSSDMGVSSRTKLRQLGVVHLHCQKTVCSVSWFDAWRQTSCCGITVSAEPLRGHWQGDSQARRRVLDIPIVREMQSNHGPVGLGGSQ